MKGAIFFLSFCSFQTVFAEYKEDLDNLNASSISKMRTLVEKLHNDVEAAITDGMTKGLNENLNECREYYKTLEGLLSYRLEVNISCCYMIAARIEDMRYARKCYFKNIAKVVQHTREFRADTVACFQRHYEAQLGLKEGQHPRIPL